MWYCKRYQPTFRVYKPSKPPPRKCIGLLLYISDGRLLYAGSFQLGLKYVLLITNYGKRCYIDER